MVATPKFVRQLIHSASASHHRYGVVLKGDQPWQLQWLKQISREVSSNQIFQVGGDAHSFSHQCVRYSKGQRLLGQECQLLICDFTEGFDANSFSAALGCVVGGGLVVIIPKPTPSNAVDDQWLENALGKLIFVEQNQPLPCIPAQVDTTLEAYSQQNLAVEKIRKVIEGHRKRPLVITADRGRGKSSALGIAAAELMLARSIHIMATAPTLATIQPVFEHALRLLPQAKQEKGRLTFDDSVLEFVAPDELLRNQPTCDCLFVDEASAIPIPMLKKMVEHYHRAVFSTTVHGYEGCGRGFTLKFQSWLAKHRPNYNHIHLDQPIRWNSNDPLEQWHFDSFLLDAELQKLPKGQQDGGILTHITKQQLLQQPQLLRACFALLVNAHYQTSPNDLMLLLADDAIQLYASFSGDVCIGCVLTVQEGELDEALIEQIQQGKRRPKGHLVATTLANQLGVTQAACCRSLRIMRIAVHPQLQRQGVGQRLLSQLREITEAEFYSTSFGATAELVSFWKKCGFMPVKLGSAREQASGTHSLVMVSGDGTWMKDVESYFRQFIQFSISTLFQDLELDLVRVLLQDESSSLNPTAVHLIENYAKGGSSYDSVAPVFAAWWMAYPKRLMSASDFLIRKFVQNCSWEQCVKEFALVGKKQAELQLRSDMADLLSNLNLHCKK
ncbi:GNAT family N-acetyltransferase [Vibrio nereis]|uniref:tRNA(Met) cytidine acetyltransferase TmcA n=1 Tax=Vibrio nereis TaxID=693 RepID=A0A0M0HMD5_VIBNE|nr:GNAT family N-acetyltransferase [Vibrio nereis]KOO03239.1 ATPase [Vibrio nereis]